MIRSLRLFGLEDCARDVFNTVYKAAADVGCASVRTREYWIRALEEDPFETLRK